MSRAYCLEKAWIEGEWKDNVEVHVADDETITSVNTAIADSTAERVNGWVIPGIPNVHSHAFQWTFAGCSEFRTRQRDSFWSWREQMYASLESLTPETYFEQARPLYRLMRQAGYTSVGEFHYVHLQNDGLPYDDLTAMAQAVIEAALVESLSICILPVLYQRGGFDGRQLAGAQLRFGLSDEQFFQVCESLVQRYSTNPQVTVGMAYHSLRAVDPAKLATLTATFDTVCPQSPVHIHVAEQTREVDECVATYGCRPVELLFQSVDVGPRWCLVHATHVDDREQEQIASSGATVGLCPMTEANLGDGVFPAESFLNKQGRFAIGSDSHVSVCPFSEMRMIEYGQRLVSRRRAILCDQDTSCGELLLRSAVEYGPAVLARKAGRIAKKWLAEWTVLDLSASAEISPPTNKNMIDRAIFCEFGPIVKSTLAGGEWKHRKSP